MINANSIVINPHLRKVNYDPLTSYEPICYLLSSPQVIVVNSDAPYRTLAEFITDARAKPGQLTFATVGPATTQHIGFEQFKRVANINVIYVPYPGGAPAMTALLGGHVNAVLANYSEVQEQLPVFREPADISSCSQGSRPVQLPRGVRPARRAYASPSWRAHGAVVAAALCGPAFARNINADTTRTRLFLFRG